MDGEKRVLGKRSDEVDWLSNLPEALLCRLLLNLPTKDVVKCSLLSSRWRNLWKYVPGLDLKRANFRDDESFVSFVDSFLDLSSGSWLHSFKLNYYFERSKETPLSVISRWINTVVDRKVKHLDFTEEELFWIWNFQMPPNIYTCESLVSLKLSFLTLASPKIVLLPSLKVMDLWCVDFADDLALETLISGCPVLQSLSIDRSLFDETKVLRVFSQSLLSFSYDADSDDDEDGEPDEALVVEIHAPRLKYLNLSDYRIANYILNNTTSLVEVNIDTEFNLMRSENKFDPYDLPKRNMIRNFLVGISSVKNMIIPSRTLEVIYDYSRCDQLPLFRNLNFLRVRLTGCRWEMLPIFLEICPNLKSLVVGSNNYTNQEEEGTSIIYGPWRFLPSLEYVKIERPLKGEAMEMKLVSYFLEKSAALKNITLRLDDSRKKKESVIFKALLAIPRLSSSCQVVVI